MEREIDLVNERLEYDAHERMWKLIKTITIWKIKDLDAKPEKIKNEVVEWLARSKNGTRGPSALWPITPWRHGHGNEDER